MSWFKQTHLKCWLQSYPGFQIALWLRSNWLLVWSKSTYRAIPYTSKWSSYIYRNNLFTGLESSTHVLLSWSYTWFWNQKKLKFLQSVLHTNNNTKTKNKEQHDPCDCITDLLLSLKREFLGERVSASKEKPFKVLLFLSFFLRIEWRVGKSLEDLM